ncbi:uncharacterized protein F54H12.2-like [Actinia tenebrosa]|uniref:Uncharacterized protein F54H12.2-like n=1 Tax=Actinia tenebrosa TaxID=6105 RepID=A0A6P8J2S0_ACTTE|nr:uncharacterized protein F54H12.2-like [Actinia tenebrosa]
MKRQHGGRAAPAAKAAREDAPPLKVHKGTVVDLFKRLPIDVTCEKSKWEVYSQATAAVDPLEITVDRTRTWIDMTKILLEFDVEFHDGGAGAARALLTDTSSAVPINNVAHSLIKQIQLTINKGAVTVNADHYHLEAYFDRLLNYSEEEKKSLLSLEGWATDTPDKFDRLNPNDLAIPNPAAWGANNAPTVVEVGNAIRAAFDRETPNQGAKERVGLCCQNRAVKFILRPVIPLFSSQRYLTPGCELKFRIQWNPRELVMMNGPTVGATAITHANASYTIVNYSPKLHIRHVDVNSELHIKMEAAMLENQDIALYPYFTNRTVTHTVPDGRRRAQMHNVFQGYRPNYMIIGFQRGDAFDGDIAHSPFNFQDMHQSSLRVTVDGEEIPHQRLDLTSHHKEEGFNTLLQFSGRGIDSAPTGIDRKGYKDGNYLILYNFNPDGEQNFGYSYARNVGNVNIDVDFSANTVDNTTMVVSGYFEQETWLDGNKNASQRYSY